MLLARRFTLNPVLVIISIVFWYWMWGVAGALLAVPLLATLKIICDRIRPLAAFGHFLGAEAQLNVRRISAASVGIVWEAMKGLLRNDGFELAGYIAFNTLLALFPS